MIEIMKRILLCISLFLFLLFFISCTPGQEGSNSEKGRRAGVVPGEHPDMVVDNITLSDVSPGGKSVEFAAKKAFYYRSVDLIYFDKVRGKFDRKREYLFSFPEGVYDRHDKSLVTTEQVVINGEGGLEIRGMGGVVDFGENRVTLKSDVVVTQGFLRIEGVDGVLDLDTEELRIRRVAATISNPGSLTKGLQGVK